MANFISNAFGPSCVLHLGLSLEDKEQVVRAGNWLCGQVHIHVDKGNTGSEVELTLRGKEKSTRKKGPVDICHHHEFFSTTTTVRDPNRKVISEGEHTIPFAIELPADLPSASMHRIGLDSVGFVVQYKLTAKLGNATKSIPVAVAAAPLKCGNSSFVVHPTPHQLFSMKGDDQGQLLLAASIQNTNIRKGEKVRVALACRNDSKVKVQRVEAKVVELLNWGSHEGYTKTKVNKDTLVKLDSIDLPGVQKDIQDTNVSKGIVDSNYRTVEEQKALHTTIQNDLVSGLNEIEMVVPLRSRDSYAGTLVDIRHYLKITFITRNSFFGGAQPSIKIPLQIGLPEEIPRVFAAAAVSEKEKESVAITHQARSHQPELPVASAVPIISTPGGKDKVATHISQTHKGFEDHISKDFGQMERQVEPMPVRKVRHYKTAVAEKGERPSSDVEISLHDLVPMVPSM